MGISCRHSTPGSVKSPAGQGESTWSPAKTLHWRGARLLNIVFQPLFDMTSGRLRLGHIRMVELVTIGRRTGLSRTVLMPCFLMRGDSFVLLASYGGGRSQPAWYWNITANPQVQVRAGGRTRTMRARIAEGSEARGLLQRILLRTGGSYLFLVAPARAAGRTVPIVVLDPISGEPR
ncbi:nitroreductase family deazaflavin-dependent oxidoreductase [Nocardia sp. NPDC058058]|uniref:nitroreductase family deazaflavin-dependent oxidoreductase n=1 Tax=Nocardia sp. NPDC058058 TaxID=3346317 RepID=UPI0036D8CB1A